MLARSLPVFSSSSALFAFLFPAKHLLPLWPHIEGVCKWERADEGKVRVTLLPEYCQAFGGGGGQVGLRPEGARVLAKRDLGHQEVHKNDHEKWYV